MLRYGSLILSFRPELTFSRVVVDERGVGCKEARSLGEAGSVGFHKGRGIELTYRV